MMIIDYSYSQLSPTKVISNFKTHKTDLYSKMSDLEADKKALQETYDAFSEARVNL